MKYTFEQKAIGEGAVYCTVAADGFKTACASVNFVLPLSKNASLYALVPNILTRSCESYPTLTLLERKLASLYGAEIAVDVSKTGEHQILKIIVSCIDDRFALDNESIVCECCKLLFELVFKPNLKNGVFSADDTMSEKRLLTEQLGAQMSDKRIYAKNRCEEIMCSDELYGINSLGTIEDIEKITPESLTEAYREILRTASVYVCISGRNNPPELEKLFADCIAGIKRDVITSETVFVESAEDVQYVKESEPVKQGKLVMGFRLGMTSPDDKYAQRRVMTDLFGGSPHSKLFTVVREKMSLCYYCSARMLRQKGVMFVQSGIESFNEEKAKDGILAQLKAIQNGEFTDEDLMSSVKALEDGFKSVSDSPEALDSWFMTQITTDEFYYPEDFINQFNSVTRDDIIAAAKDVTLDTVFMLEGTDADKN